MAPTKSPKAASTSKPKKEKVFHPDSRKAGQLARVALRKAKLGEQHSKRGKREDSLVDKYAFFFYAIPPEGTMTLKDMHDLIKDVWLTRHDQELQAEKATRRKGRPKSMREMKLDEIKLRESEEYRTGMEMVDLTHEANVELFRQWNGTEAAYVQQLRHIRISGMHPESIQISKRGQHPSLRDPLTSATDTDAMDIVDNLTASTL